MATQKDIATLLNISQQAVSVSLSNQGGTTKVAPETRAQVLKLAEQLEYVPNRVARSLRSGRTNMMGVIMPLCKDPYYSAVIDALSMEAVQRKLSLLLQFHLWSETEEEAAFERLIEAKVDGILLLPRGKSYSGVSMLPRLRKLKIPVICLGSPRDREFFDAIIERDFVQEGFLLGQELLSQGHRKMNLLAADKNHHSQQLKWKGLQQAIAVSGVRATAEHVDISVTDHPVLSPAAPATLQQRDQILQWLAEYYVAQPDRGSAVVVGNEIFAWKVMSAAQKRGLQVPRDLSIVTGGIQGQGDIGPVPLTSVEYNAEIMACRAFDLLLNPKGKSVVLTPQLVRRASISAVSSDTAGSAS